MPHVAMTVPNAQGRAEALRRLKEKSDSLHETYRAQTTELEQTWNESGCRFKVQAMGFRVTGEVAVEEDQIRLEAELPIFAMAFRGMIESRVRKELEELLA